MARLGHGWEEVPSYIEETPRSAATGLYVYPRSKKYPIGDLFHARLALGGPYASSAYTTPARRKKILTEVAEAYPDFDWARYWNTHIVGQKKPTPAKRGGKKKYPLYGWDRSVGASASRRKAANPRRKNMGRSTDKYKYRVSASVIVGSKSKDIPPFWIEAANSPAAVKVAEKEIAKKLRVRSIKLMLEQDEGPEFEDSPLFSFWSPSSNQDLTGAATIDGSGRYFRELTTKPRRKNMIRRKNYGALKLLTNPLGMPLGKGQAVIVDHRGEKTPKGGWKHRVHIRKGMKDEALCGAGKPARGKKRGVTASKAKNITCYRCIKLRVVDAGDDVERRFAGTKRSLNYMVPGGREGLYVSKKKLDHDGYPSRSGQVDGIPFFLGGTEEHPSQTRMLTKRQKAKRHADIVRGRSKKVQAGRSTVRRGEMVANPRSFGQGYNKGASDYGSTRPMAANALRNRSLSYQEGYLEGYSDSASKPNPKRRKNTKRRSNGGKMSAYNRHVQREMLKGKTMSQAAASWRRRR